MTRKRLLSLVFIGAIMFSNFALLSNVWAQAPQKAQIAFSSDRNGNDEIYVMNIDGKNPRNLTTHPGFDFSPAWSPDGQRIAFLSLRKKEDGLYVMDADGKNQRYLAHMPQHGHAAWSPDGKQIAFGCAVGRRTDICVIDADGGKPRNLTLHPFGNPLHPFDDEHPTWSPDGRQIAFTSNRESGVGIFVMDSDGNNQRRLTPLRTWDSRPAWSPDGKQIAFQSSNNNNVDIYVMKVDGTDRRRLTRDPAHDRYPSWSPDSKKILFYSERDGRNGDVYVMDARGNNQQNLTNHLMSDGLYGTSWFDPRFALSVFPVGKHVASWGWLKDLDGR